MRIFKLSILVNLVLLTGCSDYLLIERNEKIPENTSLLKIICIDPRFYFEHETQNFQLQFPEMMTTKIRKHILRYSKKNKLDVALYSLDENATAGYYYDLLSLKQNMLAVNFNQRT